MPTCTRRAMFATVLCSLAIWVGPLSEPVAAQTTTATISGTVLDNQRLAVSGATLTIEDRERATLAGFATTEVAVRLEVNQRLRADLVVQPAGVAENVVVRQSVTLLDRTDASVGQVIDEHQLSNLPLNGRQFLELALLVPGVHSSHGASSGETLPLYWRPGQNSAISVTGGRPSANACRIDGTTNTDPSFDTFIVNLPPDAIREFQIETASYSAELGAAGTGQVNVVTKSGTQTLRGSLYDYLRNSVFDARLFTSGAELPHFARNQYGGTIGGPFAFKRTFFFGSFEGLRSAQGQSMMMTVPPAAWRVGDFSDAAPIYDPATTRPNPAFDPSKPASPSNPTQIRTQFPGNQIPTNRINPTALQVLRDYVPLPDMDDLVNNYLDTRQQRLQNDQGTLRVDHSWNGGTALFGRYTLSKERGYTPENLPGFGTNHDNLVQSTNLTLVQPLSNRLVHELRGGFTRMELKRIGEAATTRTRRACPTRRRSARQPWSRRCRRTASIPMPTGGRPGATSVTAS